MQTLVGDLFTLRRNVDLQAPGGVADVYEVELCNRLEASSWLGSVVSEASRAAAEQSVVKVLKSKHLQTPRPDAIHSLATEARALSLLQSSHHATPLLGMGFVHAAALPREGEVGGHLCERLAEFEAEVDDVARTGRLPFLMLGNVPFEWTLLQPYAGRGYETGYAAEYRFGEIVQVALELLRFLDHCREQLGLYHFDLKLEHVAWHDGRLVVIDWNWAQMSEPGLQDGVLYQDLRRLFVRVLHPLLTGRDIDGKEPAATWGHIGDPHLYPDPATGLLRFPAVERLVDEALLRWLSRGLERQGSGFPTHGAAADELEAWLVEAEQRQPLWPRLDLLAARCVELEAELLGLWQEARRLQDEARSGRDSPDQQFSAELRRLAQGLARFRAARPFAITGNGPARAETLPWMTLSLAPRHVELNGAR